MPNFSFILPTEKDVLDFGAKIAQFAKKGDFFALVGDLGAGKTTFARGFISSICDIDEIPSPTFTILQNYEFQTNDDETIEIRHFDLYRVEKPDEVFELDWESNGDYICLVEWPQMAGMFLPRNRVAINLEFNAAGRIANISIFGNGEFVEYWQTIIKSIDNERF